MKTKVSVLYEALSQSISPFKEAILDNFDDIYHLTQEDKTADKDVEYDLSDLLGFAADIAYEYEATKYDREHTSIVGGIVED